MDRYSEVKKKERIWVWGMGRLAKSYIHNIDANLNICGFCDVDTGKHGKSFDWRGRVIKCFSPDSIHNEDGVIIAIENKKLVAEISKSLDEKQIVWCHIFDSVKAYYSSIEKYVQWKEIDNEEKKIVKFIDCYVPIDKCNLRCSYCYLNQEDKFQNRRYVYPMAKVVRKALSQRRLGGRAFINFCGDGETMLCDELIIIIKELIEEGHYIQIVTNTTISKAIDQLIHSGMDLKHLFVKCSLQYLELKQRNMLGIYVSNVKKLQRNNCSISVEVTPHDELIKYIDELKEFTIKNFGALPHITTARDEGRDDFGLLTELSFEEYDEIWKQFASPMFDYKIKNIGVSRKMQNCMAGEWSLKLNLATGELLQCPYHKTIDFIYENIDEPLKLEKVGMGCKLPYCYNCHAYLTWGTIADIDTPTYLEMRDRKTCDGKNWINKEMREVMKQKLSENN